MTEAKARRANEIDTAAELASLRAQRAALIEQQTAVAEVLKSISASGFDLARVLQTVTEHATRLSGATQGILYRRDGETLHFAAGFGPSEELMEFNRRHPIAVGNRGTLTGRVAVDKRTIHLADVLEDPEYTYREAQRLGGFRAMLGVPLMSGDEVLGTMSFWRTEPVPFSDAHIAIVETFARQAAVAIQNVRLFNETKEALERQTALGDILSAISASPTATQPVFDAIARNAARYCVAEDAFIALVHGSNLRLEAHHGPLRLYGEHYEWQLDRSTVTGRSVVDGTVVHVEDLPADEDFPLGREQARDLGYRTVLAAPLLREGRPIGTLCLRRVQVRPFAPRQVELLRAFAAQAAIAIENVRLFNDTKEALDQQTATSDVLKTISRSVFDLQAVFDVVVENATKLCRGDWGYLFRKEGDVFQLIASHGGTPALLEYERSHPTAITDRTLIGRVALRRGVVHIPDLFEDPEYDWPMNREHGVHTVLGVPILHDEEVIGAIGVARNERRPFSDADIRLVQTFADQATIAMENVRLFTETKEALGQQTALSDVLRTISRSAFDLDAVLQTIVERAAALGGADAASILRREGDEAVVLAQFGPVLPASIVPGTRIPITQETLIGRSLLTGQRQYVPDATLHPDLPQGGPRTRLLIPFLRDGKAIGALSVSHNLPQPFNDRELQMLETFADQAAIAIENVRLFNETKEALERQTAISDILRAIAASPTDEQPVLQAIAVSATRFCAAADAVVRLQRNGQLETRAHHGTVRSLPELPIAFDRTSLSGMAFLEQRTIHVSDILGPEGELFPQARERAARTGQRAMLATPLVREGKPIGVILLRKSEPVPFTANQIQLIEAFADQAVIAIENVRLFNETKESLERQTATSEVLKTISRAPFELQPILDTLVQNAARLTLADNADIVSFVDGALRDVAQFGDTSEEYRRILGEVMGSAFVPGRGTVWGRTLLDGRPVHIIDVLADPEYVWTEAQAAGGYRTVLGVPLVRQDRPIGVIVVLRREVKPFTDKQIELLTTFADQAVIAMENVRLFNETKEALEQQIATAELLEVISRSTNDLTPVFGAVLEKAIRLCGADNATIRLRDGDEYRHAATLGMTPEMESAWVAYNDMRLSVAPGRDTLTQRVARARATIQIVDILSDDEFYPRLEQIEAERPGMMQGTMLAVPLLREGEVIGVILARRVRVRAFSDRQIQLLETFARQATIAIENVRLFNETKEALEQQTAVGEVLKTISRSAFDLQPVLDIVLDNAVRLAGADIGWLSRVEDEKFMTVAYSSQFPQDVRDELVRDRAAGHLAGPWVPIGQRGGVMGVTLAGRRTIHVADVKKDEQLKVSVVARLSESRTVIGVPMLREGQTIGGMVLARYEVRPFSEREIELVQTFADQAAIAIGNVRLFNEIQDKSQQLEIASRHKSEFLANMSHELRTPLNAIIGFSEVLLQGIFGDVNAKQREYLTDVLGSGQHLLALINDILDLSKIEAGRMDLELTTFAVRDALESGLTIVRERAARHGIALSAVVAADVGKIEADERKVKQILYNLLSNAVKFTPDGGRVDVSVRAENGDVRVDVRDTGIGVATGDQERIFEEFRQVGRERSREGTGLGLTLTKRFVELHGGRIWLESAPGKGSTFAFTLPLRQATPVRA